MSTKWAYILRTGCASHFGNPTNFKILKEPLLVQKQTLHLQKAHDLGYLEPEGKGRGSIRRLPRPLGAKSVGEREGFLPLSLSRHGHALIAMPRPCLLACK